MLENLFKNKVLIHWRVPLDWNRGKNKITDISWPQALRYIGVMVLMLLWMFASDNKYDLATYQIVLLSLLFALVVFFLEKFAIWLDPPSVEVYKARICINRWFDSSQFIDKDEIKSFRIKKSNLNNSSAIVLELKLEDGMYREIGIPDSKLEQEIKKVLSKNLRVPCTASS